MGPLYFSEQKRKCLLESLLQKQKFIDTHIESQHERDFTDDLAETV